MIRECKAEDARRICFIINEASRAYDGVIPADCYHQPYMSGDELEREMRRLTFFGWEASKELVGVMGIEPIEDVTLIRHAYVLPHFQKQGIGGKLLHYLKNMATTSRLLVGTWADAIWATTFYRKHGFSLLADKDELLKAYWDIPHRQVETSIVLGMDIRKDEKESL